MHFKDGYWLIEDKKQFVLGINYLSSSKGHSVDFWIHPDFAEIENDLKHIASLKFQAVRLSLPFGIVDADGNEDTVISGNIEKVIDLCGKHNLKVVLTFFHTGVFFENPNVERPEWTKPEKFYSDEKSFEFITKYVSILTQKYAQDERMLAWDIGNEPWWHTGLPPDRPGKKILNDYSKKLFELVRKQDVTKPLTFGADHSPIFLELGADIIGVAEDSDFISTHFYDKYIFEMLRLDSINSFRDTHYGAYILKFSRHHLKPMCCFEFGNSTLQVTEEDQAIYMRILLYSCFVAGSNAMFPWTYCDMDLSVRHLYNDYCPQELEFGIVRADRSPKQCVDEIIRFNKTVCNIDFENYSFARPRAAIYVEKGYYDRLFMNSGTYPNAYMMARAANIPVDFVRYDEDLTPYDVVFVPNGILTIEEMDKISAYIEQGGTAYMSFNKYIHGMAAGYMQKIFGFRQKDFVRLPLPFYVNLLEEKESLMFENMEMVFRKEGPHPYVFFEVEPTTANVWAVDDADRPVVCANKYGKGNAVCCTFPVEMCMAQMDDAFHKTEAYKIYEKVAALAGIHAPFNHENPFVETAYMQGNDGSALIFLINHEPTEQSLSLINNSGKYKKIKNFHTEKSEGVTIEMQANEVRVLKAE